MRWRRRRRPEAVVIQGSLPETIEELEAMLFYPKGSRRKLLIMLTQPEQEQGE